VKILFEDAMENEKITHALFQNMSDFG